MFSKKTCGLPSNRPLGQSGTPVPTGFGGFLKSMPVGEDIILPLILF